LLVNVAAIEPLIHELIMGTWISNPDADGHQSIHVKTTASKITIFFAVAFVKNLGKYIDHDLFSLRNVRGIEASLTIETEDGTSIMEDLWLDEGSLFKKVIHSSYDDVSIGNIQVTTSIDDQYKFCYYEDHPDDTRDRSRHES
jgi:hypothetical protein